MITEQQICRICGKLTPDYWKIMVYQPAGLPALYKSSINKIKSVVKYEYYICDQCYKEGRTGAIDVDLAVAPIKYE